MGPLFVAAAALLWGCWSLFLRPAGLSGISVGFVLFAVMALPAVIATRRPLLRDRTAVWALVVLGLCDAGNAVLYFEALRRGPIAVAVLTHYLAPLLVAWFAPRLLGEKRSDRAVIAAPLSLGALAVVLYRPGTEFPLITALLGGGSAVFYAANVICSKVAARAYSAVEVTALHAVISAAALALVFPTQVLPLNDAPQSVLLVAAGTVVCGLLANTLFVTGLHRTSSSIAGALTYLEPLMAATLGMLVFGEPLGPLGVLGAIVVIGAGAWVALERHPPLAKAA